MLKHRADVQVLKETFLNGMPVHDWVKVATNVRCFVDLNFVRMGKDQTWTPEAGRPTMRNGVGFFLGNAPLIPGARVVVTRGPSGVFKVGGAVDEAWQPSRKHHLEVSLEEVPQQLLKGSKDVPPAPLDPTPAAEPEFY